MDERQGIVPLSPRQFSSELRAGEISPAFVLPVSMSLSITCPFDDVREVRTQEKDMLLTDPFLGEHLPHELRDEFHSPQARIF